MFRKQFMATMRMDMQISALANLKQLPAETLRAYIQRFTEEASKTKVDNGQRLVALQSGIRVGSPLWGDMQRSKAATLEEFIRRAQGFINWEEAQIQAFGWP